MQRCDDTCKVNENILASLDIIQHNALEIFAVKRNTVSDINKELVTDIFADFDGINPIKNITDRLSLRELQT